MNEHETMTEEEATAMLEDMGLKRRSDNRHPFWHRWKCRVFGPHEWVPVHRLVPSSGALIQEGAICGICREEAG